MKSKTWGIRIAGLLVICAGLSLWLFLPKEAATQAICPDGYCIKRGFCNSGAQIVCLPNRLVIRFTGPQTVDGIVG